jgi:GT2 family glycosyltransferase
MLGHAIDSLLRSDYPSFDVLVVDQSSTDRSREVVRARGDRRLTHLPTDTVGLSTARNLGLAASTSDVVLMTDDDCTVPATWISGMVDAFEQDPRVACVYCDVEAAAHDGAAGFIPYQLGVDRRFDRLSSYDLAVGMGAAVGYRREAVAAVGGFDESLGAGGRFKSAEEVDIAMRMLATGHAVRYITSARVVHHGFRTNDEGRVLVRGYMYGSAAALAKLVKCREIGVAGPIARLVWASVVKVVWNSVRRGRIPPVLGRITSILKGVVDGLATPVDRVTKRFRPR